ncbi:glycosyl hydrolase [Flavilitoribacter nigricans DSM 23189 = NBRC 102662]|uniref:Periplasmic beta-glucosidase n=2 Tax=Flavilitoribacter TaxID=2762562 RepID=A0A2D0NEP4_FLAN2|nr:glycosyl hydrolase [Flavilitoribacter nigricans DSM 23189 = NBRC 102662]
MNRMAILYGLLALPMVAIAQQKTVDQRVDSVLALMTLDEMIGQMNLFTSDWAVTGPTLRENYKADIQAGKVGAIFNAHTAEYNRELQRMAVEETRLGIPLIFGYDVIHGYKTITPVPLGEAASWDLEAIERAARIAAEEATAAGLHWTFAPMVDIARDPRWGRIMEGAGEDPYLGELIAAARVKGFQGDDIAAVNTLIACAKHFAAYGAAQAGRDYHTVDISERTLRELYLPPFKAALDAGVYTFMTSFNELDGVPATANAHLLREILREEWGFDGFVVTDYTSINEMVPHGYAADDQQAAMQAVNAGVDMDMQGATFYDHLKALVADGNVSEDRIREAVGDILRVKFQLGLFDDPYRYSNTDREQNNIMTERQLADAQDIARKSTVLLKNEGQVLPLAKDMGTLAVIGPLADSQDDLLGAWRGAGEADQAVSLLSGIKEKLGEGVRILYAKGAEIEGEDRSGFKAAELAAMEADAVVLAVGEGSWMSGEAASRGMIGLPGVQTDLVKAIVATGKPVVVVLMNGRPLAIPWIAENAPAILETWFAGTRGGPAIADVLFGDYNPSGKLPVTFPRHEAQIPIFYAAKNTGRPMDPNNKYTSKYLDIPNTPLYPFGYGLSYTTFAYSNLKVDQSEFRAGESLTVSVQLANTGKRTGKETVQLYIRDLVGSTTRPLRELKAFRQVALDAGESQTVSFELEPETFKFFDAKMEFRAEPGDFEIYVGGDSNAKEMVKVKLVER